MCSIYAQCDPTAPGWQLIFALNLTVGALWEK